MKTIAYQGVEGAFSHMTALKAFGEGHNYLGLPTFKAVFEHIETGAADYAVIPIENSLIGSICENYDLLNAFDMQIIGEHYTKIEQCLLGVQKDLKGIKKVLSHPKALDQCRNFFERHPWMEAVVFIDTAAAAQEIASLGDPSLAAIASASAQRLYGLEMIEKGIEDDPRNYTRFVTLAKKAEPGELADKCSLLLQLNHVPGALAEILNPFAEAGINLTRLESRPLKGSPFEYLFYLDFEFRGIEIEKVLEKLKKHKLLGLYQRGLGWTN